MHLLRVGLRSFFPKLNHNLKMETADSKGILSVHLSVEWGWPAADRGASSQECARGQWNNYSKATELLGHWNSFSWIWSGQIKMLFKSVGFVPNVIPPLHLLCEVTAVHVSVLLVAFLNAAFLVFPVHPMLIPYYSGQKSVSETVLLDRAVHIFQFVVWGLPWNNWL